MGKSDKTKKCISNKDGKCILTTCHRYGKMCFGEKSCRFYTAQRNMKKSIMNKTAASGDKKVLLIKDPYKPVYIDNQYYPSLFDLYIDNNDLYRSEVNSKNRRIKFTKEIIDFFNLHKKRINKTKNTLGPEGAKNQLRSVWNTYHEKQKELRGLSGEDQIFDLLISTRQGSTCWVKEQSSHSSSGRHEIYSTMVGPYKYYLYATAYKGTDSKERWVLKLNTELVAIKKVYSNYTQRYNQELYKAIVQNAVRKENDVLSHMEHHETKKSKREVSIKSGDFVVRTNLFRCFHEEHEIEEIIGIVKILNRMGKEEVKRIPCAYCEQCHCFFMMTSEYKKLAQSGVILCQLVDSADYYVHGTSSSYYGANASLLMLNGYNVKANNGLTEYQRIGILKNIMDNGIMTPHKIISYLDFFIAQKQYMHAYKEAVEKWKHDREFVIQYQNESKREVEIKKIRR